MLHSETFDLSGDERRLLYEGMIVFDPRRGALTQWNIKPTGEVDVSEIERADSTGFSVMGAHTHSSVRRTGANAFRWELAIPQHGAWTVMLHATYVRAPLK